MLSTNRRTNFRCLPLLVLIACFLGCSHTIKLYSGERTPQQLAYVYTHASTLAVRYMDDQHLSIHTSQAVLHLAPGRHKFVVGNWFADPSAAGYRTTWLLYEVLIDLEQGISYVPWSSDPYSPGVKEVCFLAEPHDAPGARIGTSAREDTRTPSQKAVKAACGKLIDANEYTKKYGLP